MPGGPSDGFLLRSTSADTSKDVVNPIDELQWKLEVFSLAASHYLIEHIAIDRHLAENRAHGMLDGKKSCRENGHRLIGAKRSRSRVQLCHRWDFIPVVGECTFPLSCRRYTLAVMAEHPKPEQLPHCRQKSTRPHPLAAALVPQLHVEKDRVPTRRVLDRWHPSPDSVHGLCCIARR